MKLSVLTLTYRRHELLRECLHSYLANKDSESEMVIINDDPETEYRCDIPGVKVVNLDTRLSSLGKKLEYAFGQCSGEYIYRLDDDDLLTSWGLKQVREMIAENQGFDIYRSKASYFYNNNTYKGVKSNVNNGNCYREQWVRDIDIPDISIGEDLELTFRSGGKIYTSQSDKHTMIYRWGMPTCHISALGAQHHANNSYLFGKVDERLGKTAGVIELTPKEHNYEQQIINTL